MFNKWNKKKSVDDKNYHSHHPHRGNLSNRYVRLENKNTAGLYCALRD